MIGFDTNVLVRFFVDADPEQHAAAVQAVGRLSPERPGFITQVVMVELYWVLSRVYRYPKSACLAVVRALVENESLEFDDGEGVVRALTLAEAGADFADALIQGALELFSIDEMITFDRAASKKLGWRLLAAEHANAR
ncbi:type II toxin-antitoxin system VapC family toxin [Microlunatus elymi]|uniref:Type II toxin-antitoxin system VapC family toxin n=1 Tax=Microlunatus elymi TaxID=2596828 RepID=A0A516Q1X6_9ACTN|nr:type II toxin-antitoxin system VapC family toxin [Microlunatus elymi]QDP97439.1 type II toxin-antitoxin system VapC family toxin [Microlunatus elymi]